MLLRLLRNRFGKIPAAMVKRIEATQRTTLLDAWFDQASAAKTMLTVRRFLTWEKRSQRISLKKVTQKVAKKASKKERYGISIACY
jgi:hypothetical protein